VTSRAPRPSRSHQTSVSLVFVTPQGRSLSSGDWSPHFLVETVMKEALFNVVTDLKLMVMIIVLSQVIALAKVIA
jgi:hypothetical protein